MIVKVRTGYLLVEWVLLEQLLLVYVYKDGVAAVIKNGNVMRNLCAAKYATQKFE